jgi:hypothetical protein
MAGSIWGVSRNMAQLPAAQIRRLEKHQRLLNLASAVHAATRGVSVCNGRHRHARTPMRTISWYLAGASIVVPATFLLLFLPRGPETVQGSLGGFAVVVVSLAAAAMCFVLSALAALLNGFGLRCGGPVSGRRVVEWVLVASPSLLLFTGGLLYPPLRRLLMWAATSF